MADPTISLPRISSQEQVLLCGYYGFGNGGDEALLATLLQMLPPHLSPLVLSGDPSQTTRDHGVPACSRRQPWQFARAMQTARGFIWGGGSLIQDVTSAWSPLYYLGWMSLAQRLGLQTVAWGQGVGPLLRPRNRWLARQVFRGCNAVSVRDLASAKLLQEWGIAALQAPDPVWALNTDTVDIDALNTETLSTGTLNTDIEMPLAGVTGSSRPRVAVALRSHPQLTPERLAVFTLALQQFQQLSDSFVLLIPFQPVQDLAIAETLHRALPGVSQIIQRQNPQQLKRIFRGVEMTVAMRLHALIMAAAEGSRCFALSYDPKVSQLMQAQQLPGLELDQFPTAEVLTQRWLGCLTHGTPLTWDRRQSLQSQALQHQTLLEEIFAPG